MGKDLQASSASPPFGVPGEPQRVMRARRSNRTAPKHDTASSLLTTNMFSTLENEWGEDCNRVNAGHLPPPPSKILVVGDSEVNSIWYTLCVIRTRETGNGFLSSLRWVTDYLDLCQESEQHSQYISLQEGMTWDMLQVTFLPHYPCILPPYSVTHFHTLTSELHTLLSF